MFLDKMVEILMVLTRMILSKTMLMILGEKAEKVDMIHCMIICSNNLQQMEVRWVYN